MIYIVIPEQLEKRMAGLGGEYLATKDTVSWADFHFMQATIMDLL